VVTCNAGWVNVNVLYSDGCECLDAGYGQSCNAATGLGTINVGSPDTSRNGNLPAPNEENWFIVTFAYTNQPNYHPHISLTPAAGTTMLFDVVNACGIGAPGCGLTGGGGMSGTVSTGNGWEVFGGGASNGQTYSPTPSVGTLYIRVYQTGGARSCAQYTLSVGG
jgi:hypothetical protein